MPELRLYCLKNVKRLRQRKKKLSQKWWGGGVSKLENTVYYSSTLGSPFSRLLFRKKKNSGKIGEISTKISSIFLKTIMATAFNFNFFAQVLLIITLISKVETRDDKVNF